MDDVWVRQRDVGGLRDVVIGSANAFNQEVVVILALSIHEEFDGASAKLRGGVQLALRAGGKRQQLLIILGGEGQFAHRLRADGLPGDRVGGFNAGYLRGNLQRDRKSTRLNSSHQIISYAVFCLKKKKLNLRRQCCLPLAA